MKTLRIFISSPGDVGRERDSAGRLIGRLRAEYAGRVELDPYFWEHEPMHAGADFQGQIPPVCEFNIFIGILWSRLGTRLNRQHKRPDGSPYESGTAFEFETALEAYRKSAEKTPRVLIYRRSEIPSFPAEPPELHEERQRQWNLLKRFIERCFTDTIDGGTFTAAFNTYANTAEFEEQLESHLHKLVRELARDALEGAAPEGWRAPPRLHGSPYRGLKAFEFEHAPLFFGRTREADAIVGQLRNRANEDGCPFVLIFGSSGSGKSSLLRAGVIPLLVAGGVDGIGLWRRAVLRPSQSGGDLFDGLAAALMQQEAVPELSAGGRDVIELARLLRQNASSVGAMIATALPLIADRQYEAEREKLRAQSEACEREGRAADAESIRQLLSVLRSPAPRLILGLDQLEELFTHEERYPPEEREAFLRTVSSLVMSKFVWVIATLRSDFFSRCESLNELMKLKAGRGQFHLIPPDSTQLRQMIRLPAQAAGVRFEDDPLKGRLDDVLHDAAMSEPGSLPLLSFALDQLFEVGAADRFLTHAEYEQLGGGGGGGLRSVLVQMADETYRRLSPAAHSRFLIVFKRLVSIAANASEDEPFSRRSAPIASAASDPGEREVVERFLEARLLVADSDAGGEEIVTVAHEALLNQWPRLREMLERERGYLRMRSRLAASAAEWDRERRDPQRLAQGVALAEAREIKTADERSLSAIERDYLVLSLRRNRRRVVQFLAVAAALVVIFATLSVWAALAAREAARQKRTAEQLLVESLFSQAQQLFVKDEAAGAIALLAKAIDFDPEGAFGAGERLWFALTQRAWPLPISAEMKHDGAIATACFSPDGTRVLTASEDKTARIWDAETGQQIGEALSHGTALRQALFSPNGGQLLTICFDNKKARLWSVADGKPAPTFTLAHSNPVSVAAFSHTGRYVATGSQDTTACIWDTASGTRVAAFPHAENVHTLEFHPSDETLLLTVSGKIARVWKTGGASGPLIFDHGVEINSARFNPGGDRIVTGGINGTVRLWDAGTGKPIDIAFKSDELLAANVTNVAFSPDGNLVVAAAGSHVFVWKVKDGSLLNQPLEHRDSVLCMRFSPDGLRLLTGSADGRGQLWNVQTGRRIGEPIREEKPIVAAEFSPDGRRLLLGSRSGVARVWREPPLHPTSDSWPHGSDVEAMAVDPAGRFLATAFGNGNVRIWDLKSRTHVRDLRGHVDHVLCAAFSLDGKYLVTAGADRAAKVWLADSWKLLAENSQASEIRHVCISPDSTFFVTATLGGVAQLWSLPTMQPLGGPINHDGEITSVSLDREGRYLLTTSEDFTAKLSATATGELKATLRAAREITCGAITTAGGVGMLATGCSDGSGQVWDMNGRPHGNPLWHKGPVIAIGFSPDGRWLATASQDGTAALWTAEGESAGATLPHTNSVNGIAFSPDSRRLATGSADGFACLWELGSNEALSELLWHPQPVTSITFSPDGAAFFCASGAEVRVWDSVTNLATADRKYLAALAGALSQARVDRSGRIVPNVAEPLAQLLSLGESLPQGAASTLREWFFSDPVQRTLTPFSPTTVPRYIEALIVEGTRASLDEANLLAEGDPALCERIVKRRATVEPAQ